MNKKAPKIQGWIHGMAFTHVRRQGEILFFQLADDTLQVPPRARKIENGVIRTGEKEGHQHKVEGDGTLSMFPDMAPTPGEKQEQPSTGVVEVGKEGVEVTHPEHPKVDLPPGKHFVQTQKESAGKKKHQSVKD